MIPTEINPELSHGQQTLKESLEALSFCICRTECEEDKHDDICIVGIAERFLLVLDSHEQLVEAAVKAVFYMERERDNTNAIRILHDAITQAASTIATCNYQSEGETNG